MNAPTLRSRSHCVYSTRYHLVLVTRNRKPLLTPRVRRRFEELARERLEAWAGQLLELSIAPDHVHMHVELPPTVAVADFINALKTGTSRRLRSEYAGLRAHKQLWSQSYCVLSGETAPDEVIAHYLERHMNGRGHNGRRAAHARRPADGTDAVSVAEAAKRLGVSRPTIYNWINDGSLIAWKVDGRGLEIPAEQLADRQRVASGISSVLDAIGDPQRAWDFLSKQRTIGGKRARPIDQLKAGQEQAVASAAVRFSA